MENLLSTLQLDYLNAMRQGSSRQDDQIVTKALDAKVSANNIYLDIFQNTAYEIGRMWQRNQFSVAQEHLATAIIERQMGELHSYFKPVRERSRRLVLGAVKDETHRVGFAHGRRLLRQDGWDVYFLGAAVPTNTFVSIVHDFHADLIGVSAQMVYHLPEVMNFVKEIDRQGLGGIPIMAGGFPFCAKSRFVQKPERAIYRRRRQ